MMALQKKKKIWKRKRTNSNHERYRNRHKQSQANALVLSAILNTYGYLAPISFTVTIPF